MLDRVLIITSHYECGAYASQVAKQLIGAGFQIRLDIDKDNSFDSYRRRIIDAPERIRILITDYENSDSKVTIGIRNYYYKVLIVGLSKLNETLHDIYSSELH
jgi:hypothetical protein